MVDDDHLGAAESIEAEFRKLAAEAGFLPAAKRQCVIVDKRIVTQTMPASSLSAASIASSSEVVKIEAPRPKSLSFARSIASSKSLTRMMAATGPKHSSRRIAISGVQPVRIVGS